MPSDYLPKGTISGPAFRADPIFRDVHGAASIPAAVLRSGRAAAVDAPYERYFVVGERGRVGALIEEVRWRRKQFPGPWSELPDELLEGAVRVSTFDLPPLPLLDTTTAAARRRFRLPANIVGDDGGDAAYRPFQRMVAVLRQDWAHAILLPSAALPDVKTLLVPRPIALTLAAPISSLKVDIPAEIIEHALGRRDLPPRYDLSAVDRKLL